MASKIVLKWFAGLAALVALGLAGGATANATVGPRSPAAVAPAALPAGVTAAYAVFDRRTATYPEQRNVTTQFRSASVVKLLIALDFLWNRGPTYAIPAADRARLDPMLRSSDDAAASYYWARNGAGQIVTRMAQRLGLPHAAPPPAGYPTYWGYTALSVTDVVAVYRYLLDTAPAPVRDYVMGNLRAATRCATDRYDQYFGIPSAVNRPWAVKQGWSGFRATPTNPCGAAASGTALAAVELGREALHTTGTVGAGDRAIVVALTLHPEGTPYAEAGATLTRLVRSLRIPGAVLAPPPPTGTWFGTWGTGVRVRSAPTTTSAVVATLPASAEVLVRCQIRGEQVVVDPYVNDWWAYLPQYGGYLTNIFIRSPENQLPGVPAC